MLDIRTLIANQDRMRETLKLRRITADVSATISAYYKSKDTEDSLQELRARANVLAREISVADANRAELIAQASELKERISRLESESTTLKQAFDREMVSLPNWLAPDTPVGADDSSNLIVRSWGEPSQLPNPRDHVAIGAALDLLDFDAGAKVAGPKFYFLKNEAVLMELALTAFAFRTAAKRGFRYLQTPDLAKNSVLEGIGFAPRGDESNTYRIEGHDISLIATAEITVGGMHAAETIEREALPCKYIAHSHCFRTEAGAAGRASKGLYRVHQFAKVEMFAITEPDRSDEMLEEIVSIEEEICQQLELPYRVVRTCAGDLGAPAYKKYDIEAWMPGKGAKGEYGEITSASNCTDFQSRRLRIRYKDKEKRITAFAHTVNGTAIAMSRILIAILENYQTENGTVMVPKVLRPFLGVDEISGRNREHIP